MEIRAAVKVKEDWTGQVAHSTTPLSLSLSLSLSFSLSVAARSLSSLRWSIASAEIKVLSTEIPELSNVPSVKPELGRNTALNALPTAGKSACVISDLLVHSTSFSPIASQIRLTAHSRRKCTRIISAIHTKLCTICTADCHAACLSAKVRHYSKL